MAAKVNRDDELSGRQAIRKAALDILRDVEKGFVDQRQRANQIMDNWDMYNCVLNDNQFYSATNPIFVPLIHDAVEARKVRFVNQVFPQSGRYVEATTEEDEELPSATISLMEHYVREARLRDVVIPALSVAGDVEGQYSVYVDWRETKRRVIRKVWKPIVEDAKEAGEVETVEEEEVVDARPGVEIIPDADLLVLPATVDTIDEAIEAGGSVTVIRRWTKGRLRQLINDKEIVKDAGELLIKNLSRRDQQGRPDTEKKLADAAGIKASGQGKFALVYETWTRLKVEGERRLCRIYYAGDQTILGVKLCPYWCDKVPVISGPLDKMMGVFKGRAPIEACAGIQYFANDMISAAADTAYFSSMPIIMTDPEKNPKTGSMVLGLAAIWETDPQSTQFAKFPELWKDGLSIVNECKQQIFQTLSVSPAMIPQQTGVKNKRNQSEIALEQQVDILMTSDAVTVLENTILTPLIQRFAEYDAQFRDEAVTVRAYGEMGTRLKMEQIEPIQVNNRWSLHWYGVEANRTAQQIQQQVAFLNVLKGIPPQMYDGFKLQMAPVMAQAVENVFGPRLGPQTFQDMRKQMSVPPEQENEMLEHGFEVHVHPGDDDAAHMQAHMALFKEGDPHGVVRLHMQEHQRQMLAKNIAAQQAQQGGPGGGGGGPAPGGQPGTPRGMKGPPGAIHKDQMAAAGAPQVERKSAV